MANTEGGVMLAGGTIGIHFTNSTFGSHTQVTQGFFSHVQFANFSKAAIFTDDIYGVDNNLWSHILYDNCAVAFHQRAPAFNRDPKTGNCLQAFDNPFLNYMDKTVFYRNRVVGGGTVLVFEQIFALEGVIGSHACSL
jgi:hypothetical protein